MSGVLTLKKVLLFSFFIIYLIFCLVNISTHFSVCVWKHSIPFLLYNLKLGIHDFISSFFLSLIIYNECVPLTFVLISMAFVFLVGKAIIFIGYRRYFKVLKVLFRLFSFIFVVVFYFGFWATGTYFYDFVTMGGVVFYIVSYSLCLFYKFFNFIFFINYYLS